MAHLFDPLKLGRTAVSNRICVPPMCQYQAVDGLPQTWHTVHYGKLVTSGAGMVVLEATGVVPQGRITPRCLGLWNDAQQEAFARLVRDCRAVGDRGVKLLVQISHAGRKGSSRTPWDTKKEALTPEEGGWAVEAPSALPYDEHSPVPEAMTPERIGEVTQAFALAARRAAAAGLDGVQIHAAHGYLLHQFLSPLSNHRGDEWGGSLENRMRFPLAVVRAVRAAWPEGFLMLRVSATDWVEGGWDLDETVEFVRRCRDLGCDAVDVSAGGLSPLQKIPAPGPGYQVPYAARVRRGTGLPTYAVGLIRDPLQAETILATGEADGISVGREMLRNPNWGWTAAQALHAAVQVPAPWLRAF